MFSSLHQLFSLHQWTPLHVASFRGNTETVEYIVEKGADVNIKDDQGVSESMRLQLYCSLDRSVPFTVCCLPSAGLAKELHNIIISGW